MLPEKAKEARKLRVLTSVDVKDHAFKLSRAESEHATGCFWIGRRLRGQWARGLVGVNE